MGRSDGYPISSDVITRENFENNFTKTEKIFRNVNKKLVVNIDLIVTKPLIGSQKLKPTSDKKIEITGLRYIYK